MKFNPEKIFNFIYTLRFVYIYVCMYGMVLRSYNFSNIWCRFGFGPCFHYKYCFLLFFINHTWLVPDAALFMMEAWTSASLGWGVVTSSPPPIPEPGIPNNATESILSRKMSIIGGTNDFMRTVAAVPLPQSSELILVRDRFASRKWSRKLKSRVKLVDWNLALLIQTFKVQLHSVLLVGFKLYLEYLRGGHWGRTLAWVTHIPYQSIWVQILPPRLIQLLLKAQRER